jgi:hypothetical protein
MELEEAGLGDADADKTSFQKSTTSYACSRWGQGEQKSSFIWKKHPKMLLRRFTFHFARGYEGTSSPTRMCWRTSEDPKPERQKSSNPLPLFY